jgi:glycosyltransferase involved in cell wall biosynthesis
MIFSHMIPRYVWLAAPYALLHRIPQVLWYTHWNVTGELRLALWLAARVATAVPESFPLRSRAPNKVHALGHGIDAAFFAPDPAALSDAHPERLIVMVGRLARPKNQLVLLQAATQLDAAWQVVLVGEAKTPDERAYESELRRFVAENDALSGRVRFTGGVDQAGVRDLYRRAAVAVNLSPPGMFDKAALEAMLTGVPTITASRAFDPVYGEYARLLRLDGTPPDPAGLAARIQAPALLPGSPARGAMTEAVRARAAALHGLDGLMERLTVLMNQAANR